MNLLVNEIKAYINPMNKAIITIPANGLNAEVTTNGVNPITIINVLQVLQKHFANEILKEAYKAVGDNLKAQEAYIDRLIKQARIDEIHFDKKELFGSQN